MKDKLIYRGNVVYGGRFNRVYPKDRKHDINSRWGDGFWNDIGYWKSVTRKGSEL